jgi:hypothetical protein
MIDFIEPLGISNPNRQLSPLPVRLSEVAKKQEYKPKRLRKDEMPKVLVRSDDAIEVEEALLIDKGRGIFFGDSHGLIFPMLEQARQSDILDLPADSICNADYHADIAEYNSNTYSHTTSWERYGVDQGFWSRDNAYNFRPSNSTAVPYHSIHAYTNEIDINKAQTLTPQILSIDLDFFKKMKIGTKDYQQYLETLKSMAKKARIVMIFSSAEWNFDFVKFQLYQSKIQIENIVTEIYNAFLGEN